MSPEFQPRLVLDFLLDSYIFQLVYIEFKGEIPMKKKHRASFRGLSFFHFLKWFLSIFVAGIKNMNCRENV